MVLHHCPEYVCVAIRADGGRPNVFWSVSGRSGRNGRFNVCPYGTFRRVLLSCWYLKRLCKKKKKSEIISYPGFKGLPVCIKYYLSGHLPDQFTLNTTNTVGNNMITSYFLFI